MSQHHARDPPSAGGVPIGSLANELQSFPIPPSHLPIGVSVSGNSWALYSALDAAGDLKIRVSLTPMYDEIPPTDVSTGR